MIGPWTIWRIGAALTTTRCLDLPEQLPWQSSDRPGSRCTACDLLLAATRLAGRSQQSSGWSANQRRIYLSQRPRLLGRLQRVTRIADSSASALHSKSPPSCNLALQAATLAQYVQRAPRQQSHLRSKRFGRRSLFEIIGAVVILLIPV